MAVGTQPSWAAVNAQATQIVLQARAALEAIEKYDIYLQGMGAAYLEGLATAAGDSTPVDDVTELMSIFQNLAFIAQVANGEAYSGPALPFNFVEQTIPLWNAQVT